MNELGGAVLTAQDCELTQFHIKFQVFFLTLDEFFTIHIETGSRSVRDNIIRVQRGGCG